MAEIKRFAASELTKTVQALLTDGAVCLQGVFDKDMVAALTREHDVVLAYLDMKLRGAERKEATYLNGFDEAGNKVYETQGYWDVEDGSKVLDVGTGRYDFTYGMDQGIFGESNFHSPPVISNLFRHVLKMDYTHYVGAVPSRSRSDVGFLHRDTYSFFDDETFDKNLPPFYYTVLMPLNDITEDRGPTQIYLGSHRCARADAENCPKALACPLKAGDALVFDGRCLHRGMPNATSDLRRVLYSVWHKKWYNDYSEFNFPSGFSVCDPALQPASQPASKL